MKLKRYLELEGIPKDTYECWLNSLEIGRKLELYDCYQDTIVAHKGDGSEFKYATQAMLTSNFQCLQVGS